MKKLLHERLREQKKGKCTAYMLTDLLEIKEPNCSDTCDKCIDNLLRMTADEIERYYIPRPRFEDGSIVQFGDEVNSRQSETGADEVNRVSFTRSGFYFNSSHDKGKKDKYRYGEPVKRPTPTVFDAEGVRICKGDTVWFKDGSYDYKPFKVRDFGSGVGIESHDGTSWIGCNSGSAKPEILTHRKPDSLHKLLCDMMEDERMRGMPYIKRFQSLLERGA